jgi:hypothetical protein
MYLLLAQIDNNNNNNVNAHFGNAHHLKNKRGPNGLVQKYKLRWMVRGFEQEQTQVQTVTAISDSVQRRAPASSKAERG